jgi:sulfhydrogenase subunit alpha
MYKSRSAALTALRGVSFPPVYRLSLWVTLRDVPIPRSTRRTLGRAHRAFLARFQSAANNLNADRASSLVRDAAAATGIPFPNGNPFTGIVVRSLEVLLAVDEALRIINVYDPPTKPAVDFQPCAGIGQAITEAPRGILYHRYETDSAGIIRNAVIIPPTSQNQLQMEHDLARIAPQLVNLPDEEAALCAEHVIRNYDPCISCATHFLKLKVEGR